MNSNDNARCGMFGLVVSGVVLAIVAMVLLEAFPVLLGFVTGCVMIMLVCGVERINENGYPGSGTAGDDRPPGG